MRPAAAAAARVLGTELCPTQISLCSSPNLQCYLRLNGVIGPNPKGIVSLQEEAKTPGKLRRTEEKPHKATARQPSASPRERPHQNQLCWHLHLGFPVSGEKRNFCCLSHPVRDDLLWQPEQRQRVCSREQQWEQKSRDTLQDTTEGSSTGTATQLDAPGVTEKTKLGDSPAGVVKVGGCIKRTTKEEPWKEGGML